MKRFQLTIVFVIFSAMTIGAGAVAVNSLMARAAENNLVSLTESQSERDARFIATLVSQLLAEEAPSENLAPAFAAPNELQSSPAFTATTLTVTGPTVMEALDIAGLAIYDLNGRQVWSSTADNLMGSRLAPSTLDSALKGETVSGLVETQGIDSHSMLATLLPLVGENTGNPVFVLGVTRNVPSGVSGLLAESRSTVMRTTLISLSGVFLILLAFVLAADVRIWKRNSLAMALERQQQEKLGERNRELSELNEQRARFVSFISHELAGPLSAMNALVSSVLKNRTGNLTDRQVENLDIAQKSGNRMVRLLKDLSYASSMNKQSLEIVTEEFDIEPAINEVAQSMLPLLMSNQQVMKLDIDPEMRSMVGDRGRIIQVIYNLVSNASKYSPNGSTVWLNARTDNERLHVEITDEGIGISEADQEHIFDMFWRASNEQTQLVEGKGIGLGLAKQIVEGHGGQIRLRSTPGEGTTISFDVPVHGEITTRTNETDEAWDDHPSLRAA